MKKVNEMKIRHKLIIGFLAPTLLVVVIGYLGVVMTRTAKEGFNMATNETISKIKALEALRFAGLRIVSSTNEFGFIRAEKEVMGQKTTESQEEQERLIELGIKLYNDALREYEDLLSRFASKGEGVLKDIRKKGLKLHESSAELFNLKHQGVSGLTVLEKKEVFERNEKAFLSAVDAAISHEGKEFVRKKVDLDSAMEVNRNAGIVATVLSVIVAVVIGTFVSYSISNPINILTNAAGEIGRGNLDARAAIESSDEIGQLASSFNRMGEDLRRYHKHLEYLVEARTAKLKTVNEQLQQEIAGRKQAEQGLRETKALLEKTFASLEEALFVLDPSARTIVACNAAVERMFGYSEKEVLGRNTEFLHVDRKMYEDFGKAVLTSLVTKRAYHCEYRMRRKHGTVFSTNHTVTPIVDDSGQRTGLVSVVRDTTDRQQAQEALRRTETELRRLSSQFLEVQENERKRISRELHDSIGQVLASAKIGLETAVSNIRQGKASASVESLEALISGVQEASEEVRRIHTDLRPPLLDDLGIISTVLWFCREFEKLYSGVRIEKQINIEEKQVPESLKIVIFRILQEALNNVSKHAKADVVRVSLKRTASQIELVIEDNGQGFDIEQARSLKFPDTGFGLASMQERAQLSGGAFSIQSTGGAGTIIRAFWPMKE